MPVVDFWPLHEQICTRMGMQMDIYTHRHAHAWTCRGIQTVDQNTDGWPLEDPKRHVYKS